MASRLGAAMISTSPAHAASLPHAAGQITPPHRVAAPSADSTFAYSHSFAEGQVGGGGAATAEPGPISSQRAHRVGNQIAVERRRAAENRGRGNPLCSLPLAPAPRRHAVSQPSDEPLACP